MKHNDNPFSFLEEYDVARVAQILSEELPFVAGAALSRTPAIFNAKVMANMPEGIRNEVASAISKYRKIPSEVLYDIAEELEKKLTTPRGNQFAEQKNNLLSGLDLGSIMQDINRLKTKKQEPEKAAGNRPEPVESRIIRPEEYDAYLRGEPIEANASANVSNPLIPDPAEFIPHESSRTPETHHSRVQPASKTRQNNRLDSATKKELALQQALLHTRNKREETRLTPSRSRALPTPTKKREYKAQKIDGMALAAHILRESSPELKKLVMQEIPELYKKLNERMFDFADLESSHRDTIARIFTGIDPKTAALALRFASDNLKNTALTSVSKRKAKLIISEFKSSAKEKVRITDIEDAQQEVIDYAILLQNKGEIIIDPNDNSII